MYGFFSLRRGNFGHRWRHFICICQFVCVLVPRSLLGHRGKEQEDFRWKFHDKADFLFEKPTTNRREFGKEEDQESLDSENDEATSSNPPSSTNPIPFLHNQLLPPPVFSLPRASQTAIET